MEETLFIFQYEKENYTELSTEEKRRGIVGRQIGVCKLKGVRNNEQGICPISSEEEENSLSLTCEVRKIWKQEIVSRRIRSIDAEIGIRRRVGRKNKE